MRRRGSAESQSGLSESQVTKGSVVEAGGVAVIYPLLSAGAMKGIAAASFAAIVLLVLLIPAQLDACVNHCEVLAALSAAARSFATVAHFEKISHFPLTTAVTYFTTLLLGIVGGICLACTRIATLNLAAIGSGGLVGVLLRFGAYGLWLAQFALTPSFGLRVSRYVELIASGRVAFLVFMACMYLASISIVFGLSADLLYPMIRRRMK